MSDYFLFIDTETTGLPKKWHLPYTVDDNWPAPVQVSWVIHHKNGEFVKEQNYYISDNEVVISKTAFHIHGLTHQYLAEHGHPISEVLSRLTSDLATYQPMIVGHFLELDYHVVGKAYHRLGIEPHPMAHLPCFCVMTATRKLQRNPNCKYLRLGDLYQLLFNQPLLHQHNALTDATATAACFFELIRTKQLVSLEQPPIKFNVQKKSSELIGWLIVTIIAIGIAILIIYNYG